MAASVVRAHTRNKECVSLMRPFAFFKKYIVPSQTDACGQKKKKKNRGSVLGKNAAHGGVACLTEEKGVAKSCNLSENCVADEYIHIGRHSNRF
jgi:hypothetical protein